jgi:hypothetical protein
MLSFQRRDEVCVFVCGFIAAFTNPRPRFVGLPGSTERVVVSPPRDMSPRLTLIQRSTEVKSPEQKQQIQVKLEERFPSPRPRFIGLPHPESCTMQFADLQSSVQLQVQIQYAVSMISLCLI